MMHTRYSKQAVVAFALLIAAPMQFSYAQKLKSLSLDEAVRLSLKNSGQLKIANAKVDEAIAVYHEAKNNYLPDVKASGSYLRLNSPNVDLKVKLGSGSGTAKPAKVDQAAYGIL